MIELLANGKATGKTVTLSANNNWTATIDGLDKKLNGEDVLYTWSEINVPAGYTASVDDSTNTITTITNTHTPSTPTTPTTPTVPSTPTTPSTPIAPGTSSTPTTPAQSSTPLTPKQPVHFVLPGQPSFEHHAAPAKNQQLPQTGNHTGWALMVLGTLMLGISIVVGFVKELFA